MDVVRLPATSRNGRKIVGALLLVDLYSKYLFAYPIASESVDNVIRIMKTWFDDLEELGMRKSLRTVGCDNGAGFGEKYEEFMHENDVKVIHSQAYRPTANGAAERAAQSIASACTSWATSKFGDARRWLDCLPQVIDVINSTWHRVIKTSPKSLFTPEADPSIQERLVQEGRKRKFSQLYTNSPLVPGSHVRLSMRVAGSSATKGAIKQGSRKGYAQNWVGDLTPSSIFTVKRRVGDKQYELEERPGTLYQREDLLLLPGPDPENVYESI